METSHAECSSAMLPILTSRAVEINKCSHSHFKTINLSKNMEKGTEENNTGDCHYHEDNDLFQNSRRKRIIFELQNIGSSRDGDKWIDSSLHSVNIYRDPTPCQALLLSICIVNRNRKSLLFMIFMLNDIGRH